MVDALETTRVPVRTLPAEEAVKVWDQVILGYSQAEAMAEAQRSLEFDLDLSSVGCPYHVDVRRFVEQVARGEWDAAAHTIHEAHPFPQIMGLHCHRYCESALIPGGGITRPRPERLGRMPPWTPNVSMLEWAAGHYGARPAFTAGPSTGKRVAIIGGGSACLMCAWVLRQIGHSVDVYDKESIPGGALWTGYPSFRMNKDSVRRENDPTDWGVNVIGGHAVTGDELRQIADEYDAVFIGVGRTPLRSFGGQYGQPLEGEDLEGVLTGWDVLRDLWYGRAVTLGERVVVFGGGQTSLDVSRAARRFGCQVELVYRRSEAEMRVGTAPEVAMRMLAEEGIPVRSMQVLKRILGRDGRVTSVELTTMEYTEPDENGQRVMRPIPGSEEIVEVDSVVRAIGEVYDVEELVRPLGIETMDEGFIHIDTVTRRTNHPKVWAGGDVTAGRGNHGAAYDGMWAARAIDAFLSGHLDEWRAEAAQREDIDALVRAAEM